MALLASLLVFFTARPAAGFPWSVDMFRSRSVQPLQRTPRNAPAGSLSERGTEPMPLSQAAVALHNPLNATQPVVNKGRYLFTTLCTPCHGRQGKGDGPVRFLLRVPPADLTSGAPVQFSDGYIFATIRDGNHAMPPYGDTMSAHDTWCIVTYLRRLQALAASEANR